MNRFLFFLKGFDWILFSSIVLLSVIGIVEIYSVALGQGTQDAMQNFNKQIIFFGLGTVLLFFFAYLVKYETLKNHSYNIYIIGLLGLVLVLLIGNEIRGTRGWFNIGSFGVQPVEFVKVALLLGLAKYYSKVSQSQLDFKSFLFAGLIACSSVMLVLMQPDFGSAFILLTCWFFLSFSLGLKRRYVVLLIVVVVFLGFVGWTSYFKDYQKQRILTFLNVGNDSLNQGYNVAQAIIAVGSGQYYGRGIGFGSQSQLKFLPESQNDFIFAVIAEELGFLGVMFLLFLFMLFFFRCYVNVRKIDDRFGIFFITGAVILIFIEMFINIGMNLAIVPVVGISLPFISYGGSSMVSHLMLIGIVQNIIIKSKKIS